jgi:hypothetical protein
MTSTDLLRTTGPLLLAAVLVLVFDWAEKTSIDAAPGTEHFGIAQAIEEAHIWEI